MRCSKPLRLTLDHLVGEVVQIHCDECGVTHRIIPPKKMVMDSLTERVVDAMNGYDLTPTEGRLYAVMARDPGQTLSREGLLEMVWGPQYRDEYQLLRVNLSRLRIKLEAHEAPMRVRNTPRVGYRLIVVQEVQERKAA